jgi:hypothetical protein
MLEAFFSIGSIRGYITSDSEEPRPAEWVQLRAIRQREKSWAREEEESPLSQAVARERLLETLQSGEDLACSDL